MNLKSVQLDGNPLKTIRLAIIQKGTFEILKYLRGRIVGMYLCTSTLFMDKYVWDSCTSYVDGFTMPNIQCSSATFVFVFLLNAVEAAGVMNLFWVVNSQTYVH